MFHEIAVAAALISGGELYALDVHRWPIDEVIGYVCEHRKKLCVIDLPAVDVPCVIDKRSRENIVGLSFGDAVSEIARKCPDYRWAETTGVYVFEPKEPARRILSKKVGANRYQGEEWPGAYLNLLANSAGIVNSQFYQSPGVSGGPSPQSYETPAGTLRSALILAVKQTKRKAIGRYFGCVWSVAKLEHGYRLRAYP